MKITVPAALASLSVVVSTALIAPGPALAAGTPQALAGSSLRNMNSGHCLVVRGSLQNAAAVVSACGAWPDQKWTPVGPMLRNDNSNKCLTARTGQDAVQYTCMGYADQAWDFASTGRNSWMIRNRHTGLCLVARGHADAAPVSQTGCGTEYSDQHWS